MGNNQLRFMFACGGTAGHIYPAAAVAGRLKELLPDAEFLFVGAKGKMETELVPREGYKIRTIDISGLRRSLAPKGLYHNISAALKIPGALREAARIIGDFRPHAVLGTGGYVCYPVIREASRMGIPTAIHESNAVPGLTTRMLAARADRIMVGLEESKTAYKQNAKVIVTGTPVRQSMTKTSRAEAKKVLGYSEKPLVVSFWGSLGASNMNAVTAEMIAENFRQQAFYHIHATGGGEAGLSSVRRQIGEMGVSGEERTGTELRSYIYDMPAVMAAADLILCRAGASTIAELTAVGRAAILVPSPYVTNNHQEKNAEIIAKAGGAVMLSEKSLTGKKLFETARELSADKTRLRNMEAAMKKLGVPEAADKIAAIVLELACCND